MNTKELEELLNSKSAKEIFGVDPEKRFIELSCIAHPDRGGTNELFSLLNSSYESLTEKLELKSKKASYTLVGSPIYNGDLSSLYESGNLIESNEGELEWHVIEDLLNEDKIWADLKIYLPHVVSTDSKIMFSYLKYNKDFEIEESRLNYC